MKNNLPVMLLKGLVLLPTQDVRLDLSNDASFKVIDLAIKKHNSEILIICLNNQYEEAPDVSDLPLVGVLGKIKNRIILPNGNLRIVVSGINRLSISRYVNEIDDGDILKAQVLNDDIEIIDDVKKTALQKKILDLVNDYIESSSNISNSIISTINDIDSLDRLTDVVVCFMPFTKDKKLKYMQEKSALKRANALIYDLSIELQANQLDMELDEALRVEFLNNQKEFLLREKLDEIKKELGENDFKDEMIAEYLEKINDLNCSNDLKNKLVNEVKKLDYMIDSNPEFGTVRNYLDLMLQLPFGIYTEDEEDLGKIKDNLDKTHFGLEKVKDRLIEYIATKKRNKNIKSPIICFVGPPGVGKTSIARAIADSLNKKFYKISVGGLNDSAELNGHRKTYIAAEPGKIIRALQKCGSANPLILIDEVDKMVSDYKGDPASVLLDILDYEQNSNFIDNYLEEPFDLSHVLFILTANYEDDIPEALYDRLEIIKLSSYTQFEKLDIAKEYLIPSIFQEHLVCSKEIKFTNDIISEIICKYTKEAGVRDLRRNISSIVRKIVTKSVKEQSQIKATVKKKDLVEYLGLPKYDDEINKYTKKYGLVNGLAYTPYGGVVMPVEAVSFSGKGQLKVTGMLGQSMDESVYVAYNFIKSNLTQFKISKKEVENVDIHIHFLEAAIKKDGPSAGSAIVTTILSLLLKKEVDSIYAMTGEISLRGDILKIGGLKEKLIGAYNGGVKKVFIPQSNMSDLEEVPEMLIKELEIIPVKTYFEIFNILFK